jgi:hypothetical protein
MVTNLVARWHRSHWPCHWQLPSYRQKLAGVGFLFVVPVLGQGWPLVVALPLAWWFVGFLSPERPGAV